MSSTTLQCWSNPERPPRYFEKVYDFASDEELTEFVNTALGTGSCVISDTLPNGVAYFDNATTTAGDGAELQLDCAPFQILVNSQLEWQATVLFTHATNNVFRGGFAELDTSWIAGVADAVQLRIDDTDGQVDLSTISNSVTTDLATNIFTITAGYYYHLYLKVVVSASSELVGKVTFSWTYFDTTTSRYVTRSVTYDAAALPGFTTRGGMSAGVAWKAGATAVDCQMYCDFLALRQLRFPGYGD